MLARQLSSIKDIHMLQEGYDYVYDDTPIVAGDIVEAINISADNVIAGWPSYSKGHVYIVESIANSTLITVVDSNGSGANGWASHNFRKIKTLPGNRHKYLDIVICIGKKGEAVGKTTLGMLYRSYRKPPTSLKNHISWESKGDRSRYSNEFLVLLVRDEVNNHGGLIEYD